MNARKGQKMFKLSPEAVFDGYVTVENKFIVEYMPYADGDYVKVYLYGLSLAARKADSDDTVERLARRLDLDIATVNAAIDYWTELGLMSRLGDEISYLSLRTARSKIKKYAVDAYAEFNRQCQLYISERQISPNEYNDYYALMEKMGIEWQAMVGIVKYCVDHKGGNVSCPYILAVARNLAQDGYRSYDDVVNRLEEYGVYYPELSAVLGAMGGKRPDHETVTLYKKWKISYKFDYNTILHAAKTIKKGGATTLDLKLTTYHDLGLMTPAAIDGYEEERRELYKLAKAVNKALGLYYDNVDPEISVYIKPYLDMGFESNAIVSVAEYCMRNDLKTLSDLDAVMRDLFAAGATTLDAVKNMTERETRNDEAIKKIMSIVGIMGAVKPAYRAFYENWTDKRNLPADVIEYAASLSVGKAFGYINSILTAWANADVTTVDGAKAANASSSNTNANPSRPSDALVREHITAEELNALFTKIGDTDE